MIEENTDEIKVPWLGGWIANILLAIYWAATYAIRFHTPKWSFNVRLWPFKKIITFRSLPHEPDWAWNAQRRMIAGGFWSY